MAGGGRGPPHAERLEIALIRGAGYGDAPGKVGHTLPHGNPAQLAAAGTGRQATHFEPTRIIDRRLDAQNGPLLIIHLDRVLFHPMLDPAAPAPEVEVAGHLAAKARRGTPAEEAQHVGGPKDRGRVVRQRGVERREVLCLAEHEVGGVLGRAKRPVMAVQVQPWQGSTQDSPGTPGWSDSASTAAMRLA